MKIINISTFVFSVIFLSFWHYNSLAQNDGSAKKNEERYERKTELGVVAGASLTALIFENTAHPYDKINDPDMSINATVGFFWDVVLRSNKWLIGNDLIYNSFNLKGEEVKYFKYARTYTYTKTSFSYHFLKTHHILRMHLGSKQKFFVGAGLSTGLVLSQKSEIRKEPTFVGIPQEPFTIPIDSRNFEFGIVGGFGMSFGKWRGEGRYEYSTGILSHFDYNYNKPVESNTSRMYLLVKYRLR